MTKQTKEKEADVEKSLEELMLECKTDKYKISYAALRWAKEIKQKENLPDLVSLLLPRAMREILEGKVTVKEIEKLPVHVKPAAPIVPAQPAQAAAPQQTLTINLKPEEGEASEEAKEEPKAEAKKEEPKQEAAPEPAADAKKEK